MIKKMFVSFNKAFKEKVIPNEVLELEKKCSGCKHLVSEMDNHHWMTICNNTECEIYKLVYKIIQEDIARRMSEKAPLTVKAPMGSTKKDA